MALVARILAGDEGAWSAFVVEYSPRIRATMLRYVRDPETIENLYVELLGKLKQGKLARFDFRSSLSTWLFVVARNHCRDYYRSTRGVRHVLTAVSSLGPREKRFFTLHYLDGLSLPETFESLRAERRDLTYLDLFELRESVRTVVAEKHLGRVLDRLLSPEAHPTGDSALERRILDPNETGQPGSPAPERYADSENFRIVIEYLREAILALPDRDQLVLRLRFEHRRSAREIGAILDLGNEKQVYRRLERLYGALREAMLARGVRPEICSEAADDVDILCSYNGLWDWTPPSGRAEVS